MIEAGQIRAARALLNISQADLARIASVHVATIRRLEAATEVTGAAETLWKIQQALEAAGIEFIPAEAEKGLGIRLRNAPRGRQRPKASGNDHCLSMFSVPKSLGAAVPISFKPCWTSEPTLKPTPKPVPPEAEANLEL
jgi:transcriptional regulator with XRE-family HTH domain